MRITIKGESIPLNNKDVRAAKETVMAFLKQMRKHEEEYLKPSWYIIILIVMHSLSGELLDELDPDNIKKALDSLDHDKIKKRMNKKS